MRQRDYLRAVLRRPDFRRLFGVRLAGQFGDGVFQASLAGAVLFNPDRQASAADVAAGFAVLLLPYSLIGPFAGVLLDRWSRQRVLLLANVIRAVGVGGVAAEIAVGVHGEPFYVSALVVISINRFVLSALSASLPHVIEMDALAASNALTTTVGAISTAAGGLAAIAIRAPIRGDTGYALTAIGAALPYLLAAGIAAGFARSALGPDDVERSNRPSVGHILRGLREGARHARERPAAVQALAMITATRFCFGITSACTLLLYRNYFRNDGFFRAGLGGLGQVVGALAVGSALAALITPAAARRIGFVRWPAFLLLGGALVQVGLCLSFSVRLQLLAAVGFGFVNQGTKVCVDTTIQRVIDDGYRGRVFTIYDTLFNLAFVAAVTLTAITLPDTGHSPPAVLSLAVGYALIGATYLGLSRRTALRTTI